MTKARIVSCCAALLVAACNQGDNALFGPDLPPVSNDGGRAGAQASGGSAVTAGTAGTVSGSSGAGAAGSANGGSGTAGGSAGHATAGDASPPDPPDAAGAPGNAGADSGAGGGSEPPQPVCGNGVIEAGEQCDGGSGQSGCDSQCRVVCSDYGSGTVESDAHHCYKGYESQEDFDGGKQACLKLGGHLATVTSAAENELVGELVRESKFMGGFEDVPLDSEGTGKYAWITGEPFSFTSWAPDEPDRAASRCGTSIAGSRCYEHCVAMLRDGRWKDQRCDRADGYICEWEPPGTK